jgi:GNAT superfamily N-acetyltransferase
MTAMAYSDPALATESPLTVTELGDANALVREAGWNQTNADWRIFLDLGHAYAVRNSDARVVATAATLPHEGKFAWISMVLVSADYRRQGLASRLMRRCIDDLTTSGLIPVLDATPDGRAVYRALGFEDLWGYHRMALRAPPSFAQDLDERIEVHSIADSVWSSLCDYDAAAFGARRDAMLGRLRGRLPQAELYAARGGKISGLLLGRDGRSANQLGPLIADDDETALALLQRAISAIEAPIYLDLADTKSGLRAGLETIGFSDVRPLTRMALGSRRRFDDPQRTYAVAGPEFG